MVLTYENICGTSTTQTRHIPSLQAVARLVGVQFTADVFHLVLIDHAYFSVRLHCPVVL